MMSSATIEKSMPGKSSTEKGGTLDDGGGREE